jgi:hypothetical protein
MKKYLSIVLVLFMVVGLTACGEDNKTNTTTGTTAVQEVVDTHAEIENDNGGMTLTMDEDTIKGLLSGFTSEQLGLKGDVYDYTLKLSAEEYNGISGCRAEAIPAGGKEAERVFFVDGVGCYVYDETSKKYVAILKPAVDDNTDTTDASDGTASEEIPPKSDSPVEFQYHAENNKLLHEIFSKYDLSPVGMEKEFSEYILVATTRQATVSKQKVCVIEVYEKDGALTIYRLGMNLDGGADYFYDYKTKTYIELTK